MSELFFGNQWSAANNSQGVSWVSSDDFFHLLRTWWGREKGRLWVDRFARYSSPSSLATCKLLRALLMKLHLHVPVRWCRSAAIPAPLAASKSRSKFLAVKSYRRYFRRLHFQKGELGRRSQVKGQFRQFEAAISNSMRANCSAVGLTRAKELFGLLRDGQLSGAQGRECSSTNQFWNRKYMNNIKKGMRLFPGDLNFYMYHRGRLGCFLFYYDLGLCNKWLLWLRWLIHLANRTKCSTRLGLDGILIVFEFWKLA